MDAAFESGHGDDETERDDGSLADLVLGAQRDDAAAWRELIERFTPLVVAITRGYRLSVEDAQDVRQMVWFKLFENIAKLREPQALPGWIRTTTASERAFNAVQVYISRLRKIINSQRNDAAGAVRLYRKSPGYVLQLDTDALDLARFQRLAQQGTSSLRKAPEVAAARLGEALGLWRGPALTEFSVLPFAAPEITRLEELRLAALGARVRADLALGRHAELVGELEALVAVHPLHEQLHEQLMLSLYRSGRQAAALDAYRRARSVLSTELGVDPGRPLQELEAAILAHDPHLDGRRSGPPNKSRCPPSRATLQRWRPRTRVCCRKFGTCRPATRISLAGPACSKNCGHG